LEGTALPSTNGRGQKINLSKAKVRFSGEGSDLSDSVKSLVSTAEQTAGLPRSQGYLLPRNDMRKKVAFTLAEVLITLGIIGVVAAMTLPTLIQNYQKRVYVTQLKKSVSVLSQGFTLMMAQDGVTRLSDTEAFSGISDNGFCGEDAILTAKCRSVKDGLERVFSGIQFVQCDGSEIKALNGRVDSAKNLNNTCIKFPDGLEIYWSSFRKTPSGHTEHLSGGYVSQLYIDINGPKNPNTFGRDVFYLFIGNNGTLYPFGSQPYSELVKGNSNSGYWKTASGKEKCSTDSRGWGCAARVLEEDAMNY